MSEATIHPRDLDDLPEDVENHILTLTGRCRGSYPEASAYRDGIQSGAEWMAYWLLCVVCSECGKDGSAQLAEHYNCGEWKWITRAERLRLRMDSKP